MTLVGNDTGGGLCQLLVDAHPDDVGRLVLTNCDAFEKFPPFPFNVVFAMMRGPRSIKALVRPMKRPRASPFTARLRIAVGAGRRADRVLDRTHAHRPAHRAESRHAVACRRRNGSQRRGDATPTLHQTGDDRLGHGRPLLHPGARTQARGVVPQRGDGGGARCAHVRRARRPRGRGRRDLDISSKGART